MIKNLLVMISGTLTAQMLMFASMPFITRMYGPEVYGLYGQLISLANIIAPIIALCIPVALAFEINIEKRYHLASSSIIVALVGSGIVFLVFFILFNCDLISAPYLIIPLYCISNTMCEIYRQTSIYKRDFSTISQGVVVGSIVSNLSKVVLGPIYPSSFSLIMSMILGTIFNFLIMMLKSKNAISISTDIKGQLHTLKSHFDLIKYRPSQTLLSAASLNVPIIIYSAFFSQELVGQLFIATSLAGLPVMLVGKAITDVYYPKWIDMLTAGDNVIIYVVKNTTILLFFCVFVSLPISYFSGALFTWYLGSEWFEVGYFFNCLIISSIGIIITRPIAALIPVVKIQKEFFVFEVFSFAVKIIFLLFLVLNVNDIKLVVLLYSVLTLLLYIILVFIVCWKMKERGLYVK